jgi:hypothetical protein
MTQLLTASWTRNLARGTIHPQPEGWGLLYPLTPRVKWNSPHSILRARIKGRNIYILLSSSIIAELEQNS